jgi:hypothetical protein
MLDVVTILTPGSGFAIGDIVEVQEDGGNGKGHFRVDSIV